MSELLLKQELRVLAEEAVLRVAESDLALEYFRNATAEHDTERDDVVTELSTFDSTLTIVGSLAIVQERYGQDKQVWRQLVLQFIFGLLGNLSEPIFEPEVFESTWGAFWEELSAPEWTWLGLANLQNFRSESMLLHLNDGITIRGRMFTELAEMGWSEAQLEQLSREWSEGWVNSSHVILTEHKFPKTPDNFVLTDTAVYEKARQVLLALRLFKDGDIAMGRMWFLRPAAFHLSLGGEASTGFPASFNVISGNAYTLDESELASVRLLYDALLRYEGAPDKAPVNLNLAFRSFTDIYERRGLVRGDTQLVDTIIAAEALLGTRDEITFRLAFRASGILGNDDDDRVRIFELMKGYYDTRSRVVHGGRDLYDRQGLLKDKPRRHLENQRDLRHFVRRLLVGFLRLTSSSRHSLDKTFFRDMLDSALLHSAWRAELRVAMGLEENSLRS